MIFGKNINRVVINGKTFDCSGSNIAIQNDVVIIDGKIIQSNIGYDIKVVVYGDVNKLDCAGSVEVHVNCGSIDCSGSCKVDGNVNGDIDLVLNETYQVNGTLDITIDDESVVDLLSTIIDSYYEKHQYYGLKSKVMLEKLGCY